MVKKAADKPKPIISKHELLKRRVLIFKDDDDLEKSKPVIVKLRHPQCDEEGMFLFNEDNTVVQEVLKFTDNKRSYFIDNSVSSDGNLYLTTPIDPLFLVLPYLIKANRCSPLDQLITDDEFPQTERLLSCTGLKFLDQIADKRGDDSLNAYIYNEEKTLKWLQKKVNRITEALKESHVHVTSTASTSANFVKSEKDQDTDESYARYALGVISDYLPENVSSKLAEFLNLSEDAVEQSGNKRKEEHQNDTPNKKPRIEDEIEILKPMVNNKPEKKQVNAKQVAMSKAAKGSKSISSFFKKKD